jgi:hypothetical protein
VGFNQRIELEILVERVPAFPMKSARFDAIDLEKNISKKSVTRTWE